MGTLLETWAFFSAELMPTSSVGKGKKDWFVPAELAMCFRASAELAVVFNSDIISCKV